MEKRKILFLSSNPKDSDRLKADKEFRAVKDVLRKGSNRDFFDLRNEPAVTVTTITEAMQYHMPEIVHFTGHGEKTGIVVENARGESQLFSNDGLIRLFRLFKNTVKCVLLNACYSQEQAKVMSAQGIYIIGMNDVIGDDAAIKFAEGFYQSLGEGKNYAFAYEIAMVNINSDSVDSAVPELWLNGKILTKDEILLLSSTSAVEDQGQRSASFIGYEDELIKFFSSYKHNWIDPVKVRSMAANDLAKLEVTRIKEYCDTLAGKGILKSMNNARGSKIYKIK